MHTSETSTSTPEAISQTAAALCCAVQRLAEQEGPQDSLFIINNFQLIAVFGRARVAFHNAMGARPNVHTDMFVPQAGDLKVAGERLMEAVTALAITANGLTNDRGVGNSKAWEFQRQLPNRRTAYLGALEDFGTALGYPVYDPGALSYNRNESDPSLYFD